MLSFFKPAPAALPLPADKVDSTYKRLRWQVFGGIFLGYAAFYLVRGNLSLAVPAILKDHPEYTKIQLGWAMSWLLGAYGISKFIMGSVSDRSNPRWFMAVGLLLTSVVTMAFGVIPGIYESLYVIIALQAVNGWFNGMGWPPSGKTMVHWWSTRERGKIVSTWNVAHNIGGAAVAWIGSHAADYLGDWRAVFYVNAGIAILVAGWIALMVRDTPQSCGLPSIETHNNDYPPDYSAAHERTLSFREIFVTYVLKNKYLWAIAFANAFVYFVRYGVVNWIPTYLQTAKKFNFKESGLAWTAFELAGIPGTILCGWLSDRLFKARRAPATILFMAFTLAGLIVYGMNGKGPLWIDIASLITIGFFIYGPIMMIGLHALDLVPKKAAGTAAGFTGFFGYFLGSIPSGVGVGWIEAHFGWSGVFTTMVVCCLLAMGFSAMTLGHRATSSSGVK